MRSPRWILAMLCVVPLTAVACGQSEQSTLPVGEPPGPEAVPAPVPDSTASIERWISGNLAEVDLEAKTLTVVTADGEHLFEFSDATEVVGAAGTQGLAAREGTEVAVYYREDQARHLAVRIEIL